MHLCCVIDGLRAISRVPTSDNDGSEFQRPEHYIRYSGRKVLAGVYEISLTGFPEPRTRSEAPTLSARLPDSRNNCNRWPMGFGRRQPWALVRPRQTRGTNPLRWTGGEGTGNVTSRNVQRIGRPQGGFLLRSNPWLHDCKYSWNSLNESSTSTSQRVRSISMALCPRSHCGLFWGGQAPSCVDEVSALCPALSNCPK